MQLIHFFRAVTWEMTRGVINAAELWLDYQINPEYANHIRNLEKDILKTLTRFDPMNLCVRSKFRNSIKYETQAKLISRNLMAADNLGTVEAIVQAAFILKFNPTTIPVFKKEMLEELLSYSKFHLNQSRSYKE